MTELAVAINASRRRRIDMFLKQSLSFFLSFCLLLTTAPGVFADQAPQSEATPPVQAAQQTPAQLQQLVAPIHCIRMHWLRRFWRPLPIPTRLWKRTAGSSNIPI